MTHKLTPQQVADLAVLQTLPPRFELAHRLIEEMALLRTDDSQVKRLIRLLEEGKAAANSVGQFILGDTLGMMAMIARRGGGDLQMKVRGLREGLASLRINYEGAMKAYQTERRTDGQSDLRTGG